MDETKKGERTCGRCGGPFVCGMEAGEPRCWCADFPAALPVPVAGSGCYCPACLKEILAGIRPPA